MAKKYNPRTFGHSFAGTDVDIYVLLQPINEFVKTYANHDTELKDAQNTLQTAVAERQEIEGLPEEAQSNFTQAADKNVRNATDNLKYVAGKTDLVYRKLAEASTISYSSFRENKPVRGLGQTNIKGITKGPRTIAGSIIFIVFDRAVMKDLLDAITLEEFGRPTLVDQLPPVDLFIVCSNEYGIVSRLVLSGVEFMNEGQVMSVHDLYTENTVNFQAREIETLEALDRKLFLAKDHDYVTADIIMGRSYQGIKETIDHAKNQAVVATKDKQVGEVDGGGEE